MFRGEHSSQLATVGASPGSSRWIECFVREQAPAVFTATIDTILERLDGLCEVGHIADYRISQWPAAHDSIAGGETDTRPTRQDLVADFETWADRHGYTLAPAFRRQTISQTPLGIDGSYTRVRVPMVALALYEDGALYGVAPYSEDDRTSTFTVMKCLAALEQGGYEALPYAPIEHAARTQSADAQD